jgi:succinate dehydrogenase/fumarate reductase cytochrome b subunit
MKTPDSLTHSAVAKNSSKKNSSNKVNRFGHLVQAAHRLSALPIGAFLVLHVANHLVGLMGQQEHIRFMRTIRPIYRNVVVEPALLLLLVWQVSSGLRLLLSRRRDADGIVAWLQIGSGAYLALFLVIHVSSVLVARYSLGLETDFGFAAAGLHSPASIWFFAPYYTGSVIALFTHIGCATSWALFADNRTAQIRLIMGAVALGAMGGVLIALSLSGALYEVKLHR